MQLCPVQKGAAPAAKNFDHVLFESIIVTTCFGSYIHLLADHAPKHHMFAFLHPPLEVFIARVRERRAARGVGGKPWDPRTVIAKHHGVDSAIARAHRLGVPHVILNWRSPMKGLLRTLA
jgi:hypothetical protein